MYIIYIKDIDISKIRGEINNPNRFITQVSLKQRFKYKIFFIKWTIQ